MSSSSSVQYNQPLSTNSVCDARQISMETLDQLSWLETFVADKKTNPYFNNLLHLLNVDDNAPGWPDAFGSALRTWSRYAKNTPIRTLSLFSGGGGLDIAFHDAGFDVYQMVEINPGYVETLMLNSQEGHRLEGAKPLCINIMDFNPPNSLDVDFIIGGPPCQTFSAAGRRAAGVSGIDDPRGNLFQEYVRILKKLQPKGFLFENVYGILGAQDGKPWKDIVKAFESAGYKISYRILDAADYGVPQQRERLIVVGTRDDYFAFPRPTHGPDSIDRHPYYTASLAIQGVEGTKPALVGGRYGHLLKNIPPGLNYSFYTEKMGHPSPIFSWRSKFSDLLYKADPDMPVRTIKAQGGQYTGPFHWDNRPFSTDELKRLQTFPDDYVVTGGRQAAIQQIGNSVPPQFGRILAISILNQIFGVHFPFDIEVLSPQDKLSFRQRKASLTAHYQRKAKEAITRQYHLNPVAPGERKPEADETIVPQFAMAYFSPNFAWVVEDENVQNRPWNVEFSIFKKEQVIEVHMRDPKSRLMNPQIVIEIRPTEKWILPAKSINLFIYSFSSHLFTAGWKALESYLAREGIKADLVQLNGYYQYKPAIAMKLVTMECSQLAQKSLHEWTAIRNVLEGNGVRRIIHVEDLANLWESPLDKTIDALTFLRTSGYEVRSHYTNNQIPPEHVLIPYAFPTLNPLSVQLRKVLFPNLMQERIFEGERPDEEATKIG